MKKISSLIIVAACLIALGAFIFFKIRGPQVDTHALDQWIGPMIQVDGGAFQMGSPDTMPNRSEVELLHSVIVSSFQIQSIEVTQKLYEAVMGENPSENKTWTDLPVTNVDWHDAQKFISKLNELTGRSYRLPTEAEWEFAARGGNQSKGYVYSGSNDLNEVGWFDGNSGKSLHVGREKRPNELGIYDMSGNVWEWCSDWYAAYRTDAIGSQNPKGADKGETRVLRGGSWYLDAQFCRSAFRLWSGPGSRGDRNGFRLVLSSSSPGQ